MSAAKKRKPASPIIKRSIVINGHKTSVSLEDPFWRRLKMEAGQREITLSSLVGEVDDARVDRNQSNLSSALRLHVLGDLEQQLGEGVRP